MPDTYTIRMTPRALADLQGIFGYIDKASEQHAPKMVRTLLDAIDGLTTFPRRYDVPRGGSAKGRTIRFMPVPPYLVRYRIDETHKAVFILRVRHGARRHP
jgi:plasmid stabilization system protein ParE